MQLSELVAFVIERGRAFLFAERSMQTYTTLAAVFGIALLLEIVTRQNWRARYGSRNFRLDVIYFLFYYGGIYHLLLFAPMYVFLTRLTREHAPWLQMNLLSSLSPVWQLVAVVIVSDLVGYASHRVKHAVPFLWTFHAIHHSQERMTVMTNYRFHVVDETLLRLVLFIPFQILGANYKVWLLVDFAMAWILLLQHSEWKWSYGVLGRIFVSPRFHQIHHSAAPGHQNHNFAMLLSVWDDLFGTAERRAVADTYGLGPADKMPETFFGQLVWPFTRLYRTWRPETTVVVPALEPES